MLLLSGDRHFTAGYQIHQRFIEVTSGPLGSIVSEPGHLNECFFKQTEGKLYSIYDVDTTGRDVNEVVAEIVGRFEAAGSTT